MSKKKFKWVYEDDFGFGVRQCFFAEQIFKKKTNYQSIEIFQNKFLGRFLMLDKVIQAAQRDEFIYHEMLVHVPLLGWVKNNKKAKVLIVGGGDGGCLREVQEHSWVKKIYMVELDKEVVKTTKKYLRINGNYNDKRLTLIFDNALDFIKSPRYNKGIFDIIIIDSTDPYGDNPANPLFKEYFLKRLKDFLSDNGVIVIQSGEPDYALGFIKKLSKKLIKIYGDSKAYRAAIPSFGSGDTVFLLGCDNCKKLRHPHKKFIGKYYNPEIHKSSFILPSYWRKYLN